MANMTVEQVAPGIYRVGSESSDRTYLVDTAESTCTCTNWAIQRNRQKGALEAEGKSTANLRIVCKHIREVGVVPAAPRKKAVQRDSKEVAQKKADAIVAKFTTPGTKARAIETLRDAARMKKD